MLLSHVPLEMVSSWMDVGGSVRFVWKLVEDLIRVNPQHR